ncbi:MAG: hypothetical protein ACREM2_06060, partial [Vulcanimicrobiaceae bacterium]
MRGFTLIDTLVAVALVALVALSLLVPVLHGGGSLGASESEVAAYVAQARAYAEEHADPSRSTGATIAVRSDPARGTTATLYLGRPSLPG